jgi:MFS family permease
MVASLWRVPPDVQFRVRTSFGELSTHPDDHPRSGILNAFGAFQTYYETGLLSNHTPFSISFIGSIQGCLLLVVGVLAGPIYDMGHFRLLLYIGSFLVIIGTMLTSISTAYYQVFLAQGIVVGVGAGCFYVPSIALISSYFSKKRAFASGIAVCGSSIGTSAAFPLQLACVMLNEIYAQGVSFFLRSSARCSHILASAGPCAS